MAAIVDCCRLPGRVINEQLTVERREFLKRLRPDVSWRADCRPASRRPPPASRTNGASSGVASSQLLPILCDRCFVLEI